MKYTYKEFLKSRKDSNAPDYCMNKHHYDQYNFFYAVALDDMSKFNKEWASSKSYLARCLRSKETFWIEHFNVRCDVKKGQVFVCGQTDHIFGVEKATSVNVLFRSPKRKRSTRLAQFFYRKQFKRERRIYDWFENEKSRLERELSENYRDMSQNLSLWEAPENKSVRYILKLRDKRIKTEFGEKFGAYKNDVSIDYSPFDRAKIHNDFKSLSKIENRNEFKKAHFPLYEIKQDGMTYLLERNDFELIENHNKQIAIKYINKWEDKAIEIEQQLRARKRWLNRCLNKIKQDISQTYNIPVPKY